MGVFDKIKNALFEEEYVEVEEKPKKQKQIKSKHKVKDKDKEKVKDKEKINDITNDEHIEEKPIAKKVVLPEKKETKILDNVDDKSVNINNNTHSYSQSRSESMLSNTSEHRRSEFKFVDDTSFDMEPDIIEEDPIIQPRQEKRVEPEIVKVMDPEKSRFNNSLNSTKSRVKDNPLYGGSHESSTEPVSIREYTGSSYEKKEPVSHFKPSPIISPIYGILDKNYRKEDVPVKKEVHLTSSYARGNISVDDVRKKAYGNLRDDLVREMDDVHEVGEEVSFPVEDDNNLLVDLSAKDDRPAVKEVTMGDAVEYFQDLGLEYNVDYVDSTKERATGRRVKEHYDILDDEDDKEVSPPPRKRVQEDAVTEVAESTEKVAATREKRIEDTLDSDDNLFDLIDSMYKEE